jgi:hypothetical protein
LTSTALHLGPLRADGYDIFRSGFRWVCAPGEYCRPNQILAYCNVRLDPTRGRITGPSLANEEQILQIAVASRVGGRLTVQHSTLGGDYLNVLSVEPWDPEMVLGEFEPGPQMDVPTNADRLRLLALAGRRMTALADLPTGILPGWHGRKRAWWCEAQQRPTTVLSLGICDTTGLILGKHAAFFELFEATTTASQFVVIPDHPLTPAAPVLIDQLHRTPAQCDAIAEDIRIALTGSAVAPSHDDWMFAGALLSTMRTNPIRDTYEIFSDAGSQQLKGPDAVLLSLSAEPQTVLRHRKLGYHVHIMRHHQLGAGPGIRAWLASAFESVRRSIDDIKADYETLIDAMKATTGSRAIILNRMSTSGLEDLSNYTPFDAPLSNTLVNIASKELNLMLHDIAETRDLSIVDVDAMAAALGAADHLSDGIHQSEEMQVALRHEVLHASGLR